MKTTNVIPVFLLAMAPLFALKTIDHTIMDRAKKPGDDFYAFACGGWMERTSLPDGVPRVNTWGEMWRKIERRLFGIIDDAVKQKNPENDFLVIIKLLYISGLKLIPPNGEAMSKKKLMRDIYQLLSYSFGQVYGRLVFKPYLKKRVEEVVENLRAALSGSIGMLEWASKSEKVRFLKKLKNMTFKIGFPETEIDYSELSLDSSDYYQNQRRLRKFLKKKEKDIKWRVPAFEIYNYYNLTKNEVTFPAGNFELLYTDANIDSAFFYAVVGTALAHEMLHGFDMLGQQYNEKGKAKTETSQNAGHKSCPANG